ncbi:MqnA/MqnD/SBP family protein [Salisaeta longa]|uniref:MqnA/MqnD/SBP family protein n=1 Tax=Salisaeta longa TaxID=503170 RepID=UPI0003B3081B|nr:MqnA/MqnD/SBP family protein [Salisaeta longa]
MELAIWNTPPAEYLVSGFTSGAVDGPFTIQRYRPEVCAARLIEGTSDVALLPTSMALQASEAIDVVPSVGLVAWRYPYARLVWNGGLHDFPATIAYDRRAAQERLLTRILMQEHYGKEPAFVPLDAPSLDALRAADADASLLVGPAVPTLEVDAFSMDLGREWYELVNYPMVWGLFVTQRGRTDAAITEPLIASAKAADENRDVWAASHETTPLLAAFYREHLRTGLDRLAIASLTELRKFLFYYNVTEDVPDVPFVSIDEDDEDNATADDSSAPTPNDA